MDSSHPLLPWLEECASRANPVLPFAPLHEFQRSLETTVFGRPIHHEEEAKRQILTTYRHSMALALAIASGGGSKLDGMGLHRLIYLAAEADTLVFALCDAAAIALEFRQHAAFAVATRLPGFNKALSDWSGHFGFGIPFSGRDQLKFVVRDLSHNRHESAGFWLKAAMADYPTPHDFIVALTGEKLLFDDTLRKRSGRTARPAPRFKNSVAYGWLPWSFWARTTSGIHYMLDPKGDQKGGDRVKRDINELGFSGSHCGELQKFIDDSDAENQK